MSSLVIETAGVESSVRERGSEANDAETDFIERLKRGDERAYEELVATRTGYLRSIARRYFRSEADVDEAVQNAFTMAYSGLARFQGTSKLDSWLYRVATNACLLELRSRSRRPTVALSNENSVEGELSSPVRQRTSASESAFETSLRSELGQRVRLCVDLLPNSYREVIRLRDLEELDTAETAKRLGTTIGNVKTRLHRAREALRRLAEPFFTPVEIAG
jgi:RNA polymerase sigma-70 factor (ECF subfamily)